MENAVLILVVDDEIAIRALLNVALEDDGYKVRLAASGEDAVKLLKKHQDNVHALVTTAIEELGLTLCGPYGQL